MLVWDLEQLSDSVFIVRDVSGNGHTEGMLSCGRDSNTIYYSLLVSVNINRAANPLKR